MKRQWGKYVFVLILTCGIFAVSWYLSSYFSQKKLAEIRNIQNKISTDILSSETQFDLLGELSCEEIESTSLLSDEIASLAGKITYSEQNVGANEEVFLLKKQYTILQVKDFLLSKRISDRCKTELNTIFYFYGRKEGCENCTKQSYVLDAIHEKYPEIRIYSFDYNLDLSTIRALRTIYKVTDQLPALVINGKTISGFKTVEEIEALLPKELVKEVQQKALKQFTPATTTSKQD